MSTAPAKPTPTSFVVLPGDDTRVIDGRIPLTERLSEGVRHEHEEERMQQRERHEHVLHEFALASHEDESCDGVCCCCCASCEASFGCALAAGVNPKTRVALTSATIATLPTARRITAADRPR